MTSRKAEALLVYLAVENGGPIRRESLFTLLWPGMPEKSAQHNLRQVLYALRQMFEHLTATDGMEKTSLLLSDRNTVQIHPEAEIVIDVHQVDLILDRTQVHDHLMLGSCESCLKAIEKAVDLYIGEFLSDFYLEDIEHSFETWGPIKLAANPEIQYAHPLETLLLGHTGAIESVAFSPDGTLLVSASGGTDAWGVGDLDGTIRLWDVNPESATFGQQVGEPFDNYSTWAAYLAYDPNGTRLTSTHGDGTVRL